MMGHDYITNGMDIIFSPQYNKPLDPELNIQAQVVKAQPQSQVVKAQSQSQS